MPGLNISFENGSLVFEEVNNSSKLRKNKGKSLMNVIPDYTAIDIETTGFSPEFDSIIEVAAVRIRDGKIADEFSSLVNPGREIDSFISDLTGITDDMIKDAPPFEDIASKFLEFIGSDVLIGHNVSFDINFLYDNLEECNLDLKNDFIDTRRISKRIFKEMKKYTLADVAERCKVCNEEEAHRALADAHAAYQCYEYMKNYISSDMIDIQAPSRHKDAAKAKEIVAEEGLEDIDNPLFGRTCVFTGTLEKMQRKEAMQLVVNLGGLVGDGVTAKTNYLILGNNDFSPNIKGGKSFKLKKAEQLMLLGQDIEILPEDRFYELVLGDNVQ